MAQQARKAADLPDDFAAALGRAVAGFGFLEEALKRAIHALSLDGLGDTPDEDAVQDWVGRMTQVAGDSLGALIDALMAALRHDRGGHAALGDELRAVREWRNLICHASWAPADGGGWRPGFVSNRGLAVPERMSAADLETVRERTARVAAEVIALARATGHDSWTGPDALLREAERARARARTAQHSAQARRPPSPRSAPEPLSEAEAAEIAAAREAGRRRSAGRREAAAHHAKARRPRRDPEGEDWHPLDRDDGTER